MTTQRQSPAGEITPQLRAALEYIGHGLAVFPLYEVRDGDCSCGPTHPSREGGICESPGKHPRTRHGNKDASTDRKQVLEWWKHHPHANVAIATGVESRIVVIDIDPRNKGDVNLGSLPEMPDTVRAFTGGGGKHFIYRRPDTEMRVVGSALAQGVDVKADGGYIVATPSSHISGGAYVWESEHAPGEVDFTPLPDWIAEILTKPAVNYEQTPHAVTDGFLGAAFQAMGWLGRPLGPDKAAARCPFEDSHSEGKGRSLRGDTVVFAPSVTGKPNGWVHCSHEHCRNRAQSEYFNAIPEHVKVEIAQQRAGGVVPTGDEDETAAQRDDSWRKGLVAKADNSIAKEPGNAALILTHHPKWAGALLYDAFRDQVRWERPAPAVVGLQSPQIGDQLEDHHVTYVQHWLRLFVGTSFGSQMTHDAIIAAAHMNRRHPLRERLLALQWDGVPRVSGWLSRYLGAPANAYTETVGRLWLVSAIARALGPGCQADHLLILEGEQGAGKSSAVRTLALEDDWYLGSLPDLRTKDAAIQLQGHWIVEIGELDAFRGASGTRVKDWVTQHSDVYRPPYGRTNVSRPRTCVFVGTTNDSHYLRDATGARRFWPVAVGTLDRCALEREREQLWAEARFLYDSGAAWWPEGAIVGEIRGEQEERYDEDPWEGPLREYLDEHAHHGVTVVELLCQSAIKLPIERADKTAQMRAGAILHRAGWTKPKRDARRGKARIWFPRVNDLEEL